jgi:hypothetical protein
MFTNFVNEVFFKKIDLVILFDAFLDVLREIFDGSHEWHLTFHFLAPAVGFYGLSRIDSGGPAAFGVVHCLVSVGHAFSVHHMIRVFGDIGESCEVRIALKISPGRRRSREETEMLDFGVREVWSE